MKVMDMHDKTCTVGFCPVETTLRVIGGKWKILILFHLNEGPKRFSELKKAIPVITEKMLTQQLRGMEREKIVGRKIYPQIPPKVEYSITKYGKTLHPIIHAMCKWGSEHKKKGVRMKELKGLIHEADVIVEVVDARDITGTRLPVAERMSGTSRLLIVVNKCDLAHTIEIPKRAIGVSAKKIADRELLIKKILEKTEKRPAKALFIGYPNVGKSSLINLIAGRKVARVSSIAGTTKNQQWIRAGEDMMLTDYRGIFPKREKKEDLIRKRAINIDDNPEYGYIEAKRILEKPKLKKWVFKKFEITKADHPEDLLIEIAKKRNLIIKGGEWNIEEAAKILLRTLREAPVL